MRWWENMKFMGNFLILWENKGNRNLSQVFVSFGNTFYWFEIVIQKISWLFSMECIWNVLANTNITFLFECFISAVAVGGGLVTLPLWKDYGTSQVHPTSYSSILVFCRAKKSIFNLMFLLDLFIYEQFIFVHTVGWGIRWHLAYAMPARQVCALPLDAGRLWGIIDIRQVPRRLLK